MAPCYTYDTKRVQPLQYLGMLNQYILKRWDDLTTCALTTKNCLHHLKQIIS